MSSVTVLAAYMHGPSSVDERALAVMHERLPTIGIQAKTLADDVALGAARHGDVDCLGERLLDALDGACRNPAMYALIDQRLGEIRVALAGRGGDHLDLRGAVYCDLAIRHLSLLDHRERCRAEADHIVDDVVRAATSFGPHTGISPEALPTLLTTLRQRLRQALRTWTGRGAPASRTVSDLDFLHIMLHEVVRPVGGTVAFWTLLLCKLDVAFEERVSGQTYHCVSDALRALEAGVSRFPLIRAYLEHADATLDGLSPALAELLPVQLLLDAGPEGALAARASRALHPGSLDSDLDLELLRARVLESLRGRVERHELDMVEGTLGRLAEVGAIDGAISTVCSLHDHDLDEHALLISEGMTGAEPAARARQVLVRLLGAAARAAAAAPLARQAPDIFRYVAVNHIGVDASDPIWRKHPQLVAMLVRALRTTPEGLLPPRVLRTAETCLRELGGMVQACGQVPHGWLSCFGDAATQPVLLASWLDFLLASRTSRPSAAIDHAARRFAEALPVAEGPPEGFGDAWSNLVRFAGEHDDASWPVFREQLLPLAARCRRVVEGASIGTLRERVALEHVRRLRQEPLDGTADGDTDDARCVRDTALSLRVAGLALMTCRQDPGRAAAEWWSRLVGALIPSYPPSFWATFLAELAAVLERVLPADAHGGIAVVMATYGSNVVAAEPTTAVPQPPSLNASALWRASWEPVRGSRPPVAELLRADPFPDVEEDGVRDAWRSVLSSWPAGGCHVLLWSGARGLLLSACARRGGAIVDRQWRLAAQDVAASLPPRLTPLILELCHQGQQIIEHLAAAAHLAQALSKPHAMSGLGSIDAILRGLPATLRTCEPVDACRQVSHQLMCCKEADLAERWRRATGELWDSLGAAHGYGSERAREICAHLQAWAPRIDALSGGLDALLWQEGPVFSEEREEEEAWMGLTAALFAALLQPMEGWGPRDGQWARSVLASPMLAEMDAADWPEACEALTGAVRELVGIADGAEAARLLHGVAERILDARSLAVLPSDLGQHGRSVVLLGEGQGAWTSGRVAGAPALQHIGSTATDALVSRRTGWQAQSSDAGLLRDCLELRGPLRPRHGRAQFARWLGLDATRGEPLEASLERALLQVLRHGAVLQGFGVPAAPYAHLWRSGLQAPLGELRLSDVLDGIETDHPGLAPVLLTLRHVLEPQLDKAV